MLNLPPLDTPGLSPSEKDSIIIGSTLKANDAALVLGISVKSHMRRLNEARIKQMEAAHRRVVHAPAGAPSPTHTGLIGYGPC